MVDIWNAANSVKINKNESSDNVIINMELTHHNSTVFCGGFAILDMTASLYAKNILHDTNIPLKKLKTVGNSKSIDSIVVIFPIIIFHYRDAY